ncbi:hypothetical protein [Streptomyces omiyaensis]|uniref:hypothetical protein n=1 Tax=Streptomyces omiyaensis TaxID=68247 RepID=UPI003701E7DF
MLIEGYDADPVVPGEPLLLRPGFWSNHLLAVCGEGECAGRPVPEWFGEDGADADVLSEVLFDPGRWPVFRVPAADGPGAVVVYRNLDGEYGTDYLLTHPDGSRVERIADRDGYSSGRGLTWHELIRIADGPPLVDEGLQDEDVRDEGVQDEAARFLLLLPALVDPDPPEAASARLVDALVAVGAPHDGARPAAEHLLAHLAGRSRHDPAWASPLSGGRKDRAGCEGHGTLCRGARMAGHVKRSW